MAATLEPDQYDLLILGSGEAGKYLAWTLAGAGKKTALVERRYIGGSCPNIACLPSKNFVHSAKVAHWARQAFEYGLKPGPPGVDMAVVRDRKREMVKRLIRTHESRFGQAGVDFVCGEASFVAPKTLKVVLEGGGSRMLSGTNVVISTGSRAAIDDTPGLKDSQPLTHIEALELDRVPKHLLILGGGYVGLEFAQIMRRFGSIVTILERGNRLLAREDPDVADALTQILRTEGIELVTEARVEEVIGRSGEQVTLRLRRADATTDCTGTHLLVATGRTPNTEGIGLEKTGVNLTKEGFVHVNERLETSAPGVFAVGDCAGSPQFTHVAFDDFRVVRDSLTGRWHTTANRLVPSCLFTDPELARVGLNETEAKRKGIAYRLLRLPMSAVLRSQTTGETQGLLKALIDSESDLILGFTGLGASAGEMLAPVQLAMANRLPYTTLRDSIFTHPTFSEGLVYLFSGRPELPA